MIMIWRGPAMLITISAVIVSLLIGAGMFSLFSFNDEESGLIVMLLLGLSIAVIDIIYRKKNRMDLFYLGVSTFFFIIPTWLVGGVILLLGFIDFFA